MGDRTRTIERLPQLSEHFKNPPVFQTEQMDAASAHPLQRLQHVAGNRFVQTHLARKAASSGTAQAGAAIHSVLRNSSGGKPLASSTRTQMERALGTTLSGVRLHTDSSAANAAQELKASAFTSGQDIYFNSGQYQPHSTSGQKLLAHELTHTVQQSSSSRQPQLTALTLSQPQEPMEREAEAVAERVVTGKPIPPLSSTRTANPSGLLQRQTPSPTPPAQPPAPTSSVAPKTAQKEKPSATILDLQGKPKLPTKALDAMVGADARQPSLVQVRFGQIAQGPIRLKGDGKGSYQTQGKQAIPLTHPLFASVKEILPGVEPRLILEIKGQGEVGGHIGLVTGDKIPGKADLSRTFLANPALLGLVGIQLPTMPTLPNEIKGGNLHLGPVSLPISLGGAFSGSVSLETVNDKVKIEGSANISAGGVASGSMELKRSEKGIVTGQATVDLQLSKNFSGNLMVGWDGRAVKGEGKVGYTGEKLSGNIMLKLMDKSEAEKLAQQNQPAPPQQSAKPAAKAKKAKPKPVVYVVFGQGDLTFMFTPWLNGTAQVVVDHKGFVTIVGDITPQKEIQLFGQKEYHQKLAKLEARAAYGLPVVGNVFIFANVGLDTFAKVGPARFYKIAVKGTYSTDPKKKQDFSIQGSLNISAAAGLRLRGEAGAGLEVLAHDIKAGAGINALALIQGYGEATPIVGYREKVDKPGADKKGEFFIKGDLEIAAQPSLGLGGDLFVEVDAPWWSPLPDNKWDWPLGNKEWPLGSGFGVIASVNYVFGSGKIPEVKFKPASFSADKFLTDLYSNKAKAKSGGAKAKAGKWSEKNSKAAAPPAKEGKGGATAKKAPALPPAKSTVKPGGPKKDLKPALPHAKTTEGKTVKQLQDKAKREGKRPPSQGAKPLGAKATKDSSKDQYKNDLKKGLAALKEATQRFKKTGASKKEVIAVAKAIRRKFKVFKSIEVIDGGKVWKYRYSASKGDIPEDPVVLKKGDSDSKQGQVDVSKEGKRLTNELNTKFNKSISEKLPETIKLYGKDIKKSVAEEYRPKVEEKVSKKEGGGIVMIITFGVPQYKDLEKLTEDEKKKWQQRSSSRISAGQKIRAFKDEGLKPVIKKFLFDETPKKVHEFKKLINEYNHHEGVVAIIVQKPEPSKLEPYVKKIARNKDPDALSASKKRKFKHPATSEAIVRLVESFAQSNEKVAVVGGGGFIGKSVVDLLKEKNIGPNPGIFELKGRNLKELIQYQIVVSAVGKPGIIKSEHLTKEHVLVVDTGFIPIGKTQQGKVEAVGDVTEEAQKKPKHITPVPGGTGPLEMAVLIERVAQLLGVKVEPWKVKIVQDEKGKKLKAEFKKSS